MDDTDAEGFDMEAEMRAEMEMDLYEQPPKAIAKQRDGRRENQSEDILSWQEGVEVYGRASLVQLSRTFCRRLQL